MKKYPKIGIRPTIDGRQGGVRESLEEKTMNLAKAVAELISSNLKNGDGSPVECVIADSTIGRVPLVRKSLKEKGSVLPLLLLPAGATVQKQWI
jgi:L-fucose isomerase-like protein